MSGTRVESIIFPDDSEQTTAASGSTGSNYIALIGGDYPAYTGGTPILLDTVISNASGAFNISTGEYTAQVTGIHSISAGFGGNFANGGDIFVYVNGVQAPLAGSLSNSQAGGVYPQGLTFLNLTAGDVVTICPANSSSSSIASYNQICIYRVL